MVITPLSVHLPGQRSALRVVASVMRATIAHFLNVRVWETRAPAIVTATATGAYPQERLRRDGDYRMNLLLSTPAGPLWRAYDTPSIALVRRTLG
jgi:hypothetical protein